MSTSTIRMEVKNWITWGFVILVVIAAIITLAAAGSNALARMLPFYGIGFGLMLILDAIFYWQLFVVVRETTKTEYRVSCAIIGVLFIVLGILTLVGVI